MSILHIHLQVKAGLHTFLKTVMCTVHVYFCAENNCIFNISYTRLDIGLLDLTFLLRPAACKDEYEVM